MQRLTTAILLSALVAFPLSGAHVFNHEDRHEVCEVYGDPHLHAVDDRHAHYHHTAPAKTAHEHGGVLYPAGHTHPSVYHDPCDQTGTVRMGFEDAPALEEVPVTDLLRDHLPGTVVAFDGEAYRLNVSGLTEQQNLVIHGDHALASMGFPGSGTPEDPYIIEGYLIRNVMEIKDTRSCIEVRDNVVASLGVDGPLADLEDILDVDGLLEEAQALLEDLQGGLANAQQVLDALEAQQVSWQERRTSWNDRMADWNTQASDLRQALQVARADKWAAHADAVALAMAVDAVTAEYEALLEEADRAEAAPRTGDLTSRLGALGDFVADTAPEDADLQQRVKAVQDRIADLSARIPAVTKAQAQADAALAAARDDWAVFLEETQSLRDANHAFRIEDSAYRKQLQTARADVKEARAAVDTQEDVVQELMQKVADETIEYAGQTYDDLDSLARSLLDEAVALLDETKAGRMILDWNGVCLHVYNNIVEDLRVNRNNHRTGYATGGIIEDNRIGVVGQLRHYDGIFRQNEVGDRGILDAFLDADTPLPMQARAMNVDGFNQGILEQNLVYGSVDLDFHGHHHGPGFFTPQSHYHGSDPMEAYMMNPDGTCSATHMHMGDKSIPQQVKETVLGEEEHCLPHHDHGKRWTSATFQDNLVIDPAGYGVRYEDQNHEGDDRWANSEDMHELDRPHFHQSFIVLEGNTVLGSVWVDIFNADGIEVWSDDFSEVQHDPVTNEVLQAALHLGAKPINSHPFRNDGWLDILDNTVLRIADGGKGALHITQVKEADLMDISGNRAFLVPLDAAPGGDRGDFLAWLATAGSGDVDHVAEDIAAWGTDAEGGTGILLRGLRDSTVRVCDNVLRGFAQGFVARNGILDDSTIMTCPGNDWGAANPQVDVRFSPVPTPTPSATQPVRDITDDTLIGPVVDPVLDEADPVVAKAQDTVEEVLDDLP